jgi:hypothetical protein
MAAVTIIRWNGSDLPEELRALPAGEYVVESVDDKASGLLAALDALRGKKREEPDVERARR